MLRQIEHSVGWTVPTVLAVAFWATPVLGVVAHSPDSPANRPSDSILGRWGDNGSCVVISPSFVITTRHQGGWQGMTVTINGQAYTVAEITPNATADLCVARLTTANGLPAYLNNFAGLYSARNEYQKTFVMGGYGKVAGTIKYAANGLPYAYAWSGSDNNSLHWGANYVDRYSFSIPGSPFSSEAIQADFDAPGRGGAVACESAVAEFDSGGGWFLPADGMWKVAGLSAAVEHAGESWFGDPVYGGPDPDALYAVRVSTYASWIDGVVKSFRVPGDANRDGFVNMTDLGILALHFRSTGTWSDGDFTGDGLVNLADLGLISAFWGYGTNMEAPPSSAPAPEPCSAVLLGLAGVSLAARRRMPLKASR